MDTSSRTVCPGSLFSTTASLSPSSDRRLPSAPCTSTESIIRSSSA